MQDTFPKKVQLTARKAALKAGRYLNGKFRTLKAEDVRQKGPNDYVTQIDREAEDIIRQTIQQTFPEHGFWGEEDGLTSASSPFLWVIDPLDGTTNFIHGVPVYAISLALLKEGRVCFGLIADPVRGEIFHAWEGYGCYCNGIRQQISAQSELKNALGATGFPFRSPAMVEPYMETFNLLLRQVSDLRRAGSAAIDLAYTACGRFDFFWEAFLQPWDFMAGKLLIQEAGGQISNFAGEELGLRPDTVIATNPVLFPQISAIIKPIFNHLVPKQTG